MIGRIAMFAASASMFTTWSLLKEQWWWFGAGGLSLFAVIWVAVTADDNLNRIVQDARRRDEVME